jgi:adenylate cyclase
VNTPPAVARSPLSAALLGGIALAISAVMLVTHTFPYERGLRLSLFDTYQRFLPRERQGDPVVIVEIDEKSLRLLGQWPWPRSRLAGLVAQLASAEPAVIAIDALFPEPDQYSPATLALQLGLDPADTKRLLATIPDSDLSFANEIAKAPVILGLAGVPETLPLTAPARTGTPILEQGEPALKFVRRYPDLLRNLPALDAAARGHGALNAEPENGVLRRVPALIGSVAGTLVPGFAVEILRFAAGDEPLVVRAGPRGIRQVTILDRAIPTTPNGEWWLHFSRWEERPKYSAADVLRGATETADLRGRIILIGYTALGLRDAVTTPRGQMPGVEVHAEAIENALEGRLLARTERMETIELGLLLSLGVIAVIGVLQWRPIVAAASFLLTATIFFAGGMFVFMQWGLLLDVANPIAAGGLVFATSISAALSDTRTQRRILRQQLATAHEAETRARGELDAARRIQLGMLPDPRSVNDDPRLDLACQILSAKAVGGDLYDFFRIDHHRLFFLIGDVSGKGLPSALFMALAKAQIRGAALRTLGEPGVALTEANHALVHDNPEMLFITAFAGLLDLKSGALRWSNAGHDSPYKLTGSTIDNAYSAVGPPLCAIDDFVYRTECTTIADGSVFCLMTDGVSEARNIAEELFGSPRIAQTFTGLPIGATAGQVIAALKTAVDQFAGAAEQADDLTLLCIRRKGSSVDIDSSVLRSD